ncbi:MAG: integrin, partial [Nitrospira sp.]
YVFTRTGTTWSQQAYVKSSNTDTGDGFGISVALSADGNALAIGAYNESSTATGINGNQADNSAPDSGAVYVYRAR